MSSISPASTSPVVVTAAARQIGKPAQTTSEEPVRLTLAPIDSVDISPEARAAESSADRISRVKQQLKDGTYLHPDKFDIALDRLIDHLS